MGVGDIIAVTLALVALCLKGHGIGGVGFLQQGIANVTLAFEDIADGGIKPADFSIFAGDALGIQLAPALVACSAWLSVNGGEADTFAKLLFGYGLLQLLFMLRLMPWYLRQPFNASFWSFSFGISALATTGLHLGQARGDGFFHHLAMPLFIFSNLVVGLLLLRTALLLVSGKLLLQVDRETLLNKKEGS